MKLNRYLNEQLIDGMIETLKYRCAPFIKEARKWRDGIFLYRGSLKSIRPDPRTGLEARRVRKERPPRDIPMPIHKYLDDEMKAKFGWRARSEGVFATSSFMNAADFGIPYLFFPAERFKFVYGIESGSLAIGDVLGALDRIEVIFWQSGKWIMDTSKEWEDIERELDLFMDNFTNKDLASGVLKGAEIMFNCKYYYLVDPKFDTEIGKMIWG